MHYKSEVISYNSYNWYVILLESNWINQIDEQNYLILLNNIFNH